LGTGQSQVGMRFGRARLQLDGSPEKLLCLLDARAIEFQETEQVQRVENVGPVAQDFPTERARFVVLASLKGRDGRREQDLDLLL
ncbi:MAG: hypothetical protein WBE02_02030, partial [Bradyrhizobium sp.]